MSELCFYRDTRHVTVDDFLIDITNVQAKINALSSQCFVLNNTDSYKFTVTLFALILEKRHVLLPPNGQPKTLQTIAELYDASLADFDFQTLSSSNNIASKINSNQLSQSQRIIDLFNMFEGQITFFTSGTTSNAKPIEKSCRQLKLEVNSLIATFSKTLNITDKSKSRVVSTVSHQHIYGLLFKIMLPLKLGLPIESSSFEYPEHLFTYLNKLTITKVLLISSPAHLKRLVIDNVLSAIKHKFVAVFSSGGPLAVNVSQLFTEQMQLSPIEVYGSTETGGIAWRTCTHGISEPWRMFSGITYSTTSKGLLNLSSPYLTEQHYITDDIIEPICGATFNLLGRVDRTIKLEEKRINLSHVEQSLMNHCWVNDVRVLVRENNSRVSLCALVELNKQANEHLLSHGKRAINEALKQHLLAEFERICLPKKWRYIKRLPYNSQGKLNLKDLERWFD